MADHVIKRTAIGDLVAGRTYLTYERNPVNGELRSFLMHYAGESNKDEFRKARYIFEIPNEDGLENPPFALFDGSTEKPEVQVVNARTGEFYNIAGVRINYQQDSLVGVSVPSMLFTAMGLRAKLAQSKLNKILNELNKFRR